MATASVFYGLMADDSGEGGEGSVLPLGVGEELATDKKEGFQ